MRVRRGCAAGVTGPCRDRKRSRLPWTPAPPARSRAVFSGGMGEPCHSSSHTNSDPVVGELEADTLAKPWLRGSRLKAGPGFCTPCEAVLDGIQLGEARVCELTCFLATSGRVTGKQTESYRRIGGTVGKKCCSGWQRPAFFSSECEKHLVSPSQTCLRCSSRTRRLWSA